MLFDLIEIRRGKSKIVMTDHLSKVKNRRKTLLKGHRGDRTEYKIEENKNKNGEKYKQKPVGWYK